MIHQFRAIYGVRIKLFMTSFQAGKLHGDAIDVDSISGDWM